MHVAERAPSGSRKHMLHMQTEKLPWHAGRVWTQQILGAQKDGTFGPRIQTLSGTLGMPSQVAKFTFLEKLVVLFVRCLRGSMQSGRDLKLLHNLNGSIA